eukprot:1827255-Pyramimonas_sp.AAC.1
MQPTAPTAELRIDGRMSESESKNGIKDGLITMRSNPTPELCEAESFCTLAASSEELRRLHSQGSSFDFFVR